MTPTVSYIWPRSQIGDNIVKFYGVFKVSKTSYIEVIKFSDFVCDRFLMDDEPINAWRNSKISCRVSTLQPGGNIYKILINY